ncbi:hypothetical protein DUI87_34342 [Hirundo rustica rustica]|uniref:Integrase catalytic domain-containing protein n=1 Tax=Hirundo rustica rustica TaxID=333673 RepID=A0A3M0IIH8_HIRRU|nr:hypothetical protein DUI87_34342 [Hirundo rustica rustica]
MVEATTGWLETYPVPHATARNTILGLEKQVLWRHGTPERIESDNGTHFKNSLINTWAREHGIEWVYHIPYHAPAAGKVERHNALLKTQLKALGGGSFKNWEQHLAKATWLVNTRGSTNRAGPAQAEPLHTIDGDKVPVVHARVMVKHFVHLMSISGGQELLSSWCPVVIETFCPLGATNVRDLLSTWRPPVVVRSFSPPGVQWSSRALLWTSSDGQALLSSWCPAAIEIFPPLNVQW